MPSAVARPIRSWSKLLTSSIRTSTSSPLVFFAGAPLRPVDVDAELLGRPVHVLVDLSDLDSAPSALKTSTLRQSACISLMSTLKLSGMPGSGMFSPLTIAS